MASGGKDRPKSKLYVRDLPYSVLRELCGILDSNKVWEQLGGEYMKFNYLELNKFGRAVYLGESPAHQMLIQYDQRNGSIDRLVVYLSRLKQFRAMKVLRPFASERVAECFVEKGNTTSILQGAKYSDWPMNTSKEKFSGMSTTSMLNSPHMSYDGMPPSYTSSPHKEPVEEFVPSEFNMEPDDRNFPAAKSADNRYHFPMNFNHSSSGENLKSKEIPDYEKMANCSTASRKHPANESPEACEHFNVPCKNRNLVSSAETENGERKVINAEKHMSEKVLNQHLQQSLPVNRNIRPIQDVNGRKESKPTNGKSPTGSNEDNAAVPSRKISIEDNTKNTTNIVPPKPPRKIDEHKRKISNTSKTGSIPPSSVLQIPFHEIEEATNKFTSTVLGRGGFGTVYEGKWKMMKVAIKMIRRNHDKVHKTKSEDPKVEQSFTELKTLDSCRHDNIVPLYGYCLNEEGLCLVYQLQVNGSLEDHLQCRNNFIHLSWSKRCSIIRGAACGIGYLHSLPVRPLIHGDIKSANILLDKDLEPKIGDFGLVTQGPDGDETHRDVDIIHGTRPYLPTEYLKDHKLSTKVDSYSLGVVLFEVATGARAYDENTDRKGMSAFLVNYVKDKHKKNELEKIRDPKAGNTFPGLFYFLISLGQQCTDQNKNKRPEMNDLIQVIDNQLEHLANTIRKKSNPIFNFVPEKPTFGVHIQQQVYPLVENKTAQPAKPAARPSPLPLHQVNNGSLHTPKPKSPVEQTSPMLSTDLDMDEEEPIVKKPETKSCHGDSLPPSYYSAVNTPKEYIPVVKDPAGEGTVGKSPQRNEIANVREEETSALLPNLSIFNNKNNNNNGQEHNRASNGIEGVDDVSPSRIHLANSQIVPQAERSEVLSESSLSAKGKSLVNFGIFGDDLVREDLQNLSLK